MTTPEEGDLTPATLTAKTLTTRVRVPDELLADSTFDTSELMQARRDGADEPAIVMPAEPLSGLCVRCGERKDDTGWFESWEGRLEICGECWSDTAMEE